VLRYRLARVRSRWAAPSADRSKPETGDLMNTTEFVALVKARKAGASRWVAKCPAYPDRSPSLSIRECDDGRLAFGLPLRAQARTEPDALGLKIRDLFRGPPPHPEQRRAARAVEEAREQKALCSPLSRPETYSLSS
jgi:hypothetical protein